MYANLTSTLKGRVAVSCVIERICNARGFAPTIGKKSGLLFSSKLYGRRGEMDLFIFYKFRRKQVVLVLVAKFNPAQLIFI